MSLGENKKNCITKPNSTLRDYPETQFLLTFLPDPSSLKTLRNKFCTREGKHAFFTLAELQLSRADLFTCDK